MTEMRELTKEEAARLKGLFDRVEARIVDVLLLGERLGDYLFDDWGSNLVWARNEDTSLTDHVHLAALETADRYAEGVERMSGTPLAKTTIPMLPGIRSSLLRAGTRCVALDCGLIRDVDIPDCLDEIENAVLLVDGQWGDFLGALAARDSA